LEFSKTVPIHQMLFILGLESIMWSCFDEQKALTLLFHLDYLRLPWLLTLYVTYVQRHRKLIWNFKAKQRDCGKYSKKLKILKPHQKLKSVLLSIFITKVLRLSPTPLIQSTKIKIVLISKCCFNAILVSIKLMLLKYLSSLNFK
jgi:hypothetical protein